MKKLFIKILIIIGFLFIPLYSFANDNIRITNENSGKSMNNDAFEEMWSSNFFYVWKTWEKWIKFFLLNIARDLRVIVFAFVLLIWVIMVIKLIFAENTEEEQKKLKTWILWTSIWIMIMQIAFSVYKVLFDRNIWAFLAKSFTARIIEPFIDMLMLFVSFAFIAIWIYAFYKIVTAGWDEEKVKKWKKSIIQAIIWFIVIKFADVIVRNTYNPDCWSWWIIIYWWTNICENITDNAKIITVLINWVNSFIALVIVIMIIYAWFLVMTWWWDEEKNKKAKNIILYVWIWLLILFASYAIMTFFINPESPI